MAQSTWETRELPLLEVIARDDLAPRHNLTADDVAREAGLGTKQAWRGLRAPMEADMIAGPRAWTSDYGPLNIRIRERGRRAVGAWPSGDPAADLMRLLEDRLAATEDEAERGRLTRLLEGAKGVGTVVLAELLVAVVRQQTGLP